MRGDAPEVGRLRLGEVEPDAVGVEEGHAREREQEPHAELVAVERRRALDVRDRDEDLADRSTGRTASSGIAVPPRARRHDVADAGVRLGARPYRARLPMPRHGPRPPRAGGTLDPSPTSAAAPARAPRGGPVRERERAARRADRARARRGSSARSSTRGRGGFCFELNGAFACAPRRRWASTSRCCRAASGATRASGRRTSISRCGSRSTGSRGSSTSGRATRSASRCGWSSGSSRPTRAARSGSSPAADDAGVRSTSSGATATARWRPHYRFEDRPVGLDAFVEVCEYLRTSPDVAVHARAGSAPGPCPTAGRRSTATASWSPTTATAAIRWSTGRSSTRRSSAGST